MKKQGFTLIELLIVIAIIGILAAVLIPNLLNARNQAQLRAAQAYSSQVYTAAMAVLASDARLTPTLVAAAVQTACQAAGRPAVNEISITPPGGTATTYQFGFPAAPANVTDCAVEGRNSTGVMRVVITANPGPQYFVNGQAGVTTAPAALPPDPAP